MLNIHQGDLHVHHSKNGSVYFILKVYAHSDISGYYKHTIIIHTYVFASAEARGLQPLALNMESA